MNRQRTTLVIITIFIFAVGGTLLVAMMTGGESKSSSKATPAAAAPAAANGIWDVGDTWLVNVTQDAGSVTPEGTEHVVKIPYQFEVMSAPTAAGGVWSVHVTQAGAEGPFANGWNLTYAEKAGKLVLSTVAMGKDKALDAELAAIVLGPDFPYEVVYSAPPKPTVTLAQDTLLKRTALPPGALPETGNGVRPPAQAPAAPRNETPAP